MRLAVLLFVAACGTSPTTVDFGKPDFTTGPDQAAPTACTMGGGSCKAVGDCAQGAGFLSDLDCNGGAAITCCFTTCGSAVESFACCNANESLRPTCTNATLACDPGLTMCGQDGGTQ